MRTRLLTVVIRTLCLMWPMSALCGPDWVVIDQTFQVRQADRSSLQRQGPWVEFKQRWIAPKTGKPSDADGVERMAVNCLTGAYGETQYFTTDSNTRKRVLQVREREEIEHAQTAEGRLLLSDNSTELGRALVTLACSCSTQSNPVASDIELTTLYNRYVAEPLNKEEFHLQFLRAPSRATALAVIEKLRQGIAFEKVFDEYTSTFDAQTFPHGDLGVHLETEWPSAQASMFRRLKPGEFTTMPYEGAYGWEIYKLLSKRTIPAPTLAELRPRLTQYVARAKSCGWPL